MGSKGSEGADMLTAAPPRAITSPPSSSNPCHQLTQLPHNQESDEECSSLESGSEAGDGCHAPTTPGSGQDSRGHSPQQAHTPPEHKHPINGFMSSMPGLQALAAMQGTGLGGSPVASSPLGASPLASPLASSPMVASTVGNAPLNLSINSAQPNSNGSNLTNNNNNNMNNNRVCSGVASQQSQQQPLVPQSGMPQLILASGQIVQGIQGAQLLIPTSQGIMTQTILTIPLNTNGNAGVVGGTPTVPNQQMMSSTLANIAHQYNQNNNVCPSPGLGLSQLINNGSAGQNGPLPYQQTQPAMQSMQPSALQSSSLQHSALQQSATALQQSALQMSAAALQQGAMQHNAMQVSALQASAMQASAMQASAMQASAMQASAMQASAMQASAMQASALQASAMQASALQANPMQQNVPMQPGLQQRLESPQLPPPSQKSPQHHYNPPSQCVKLNGSGSGASSPGSPLNTISRLAANNTDLTITTTSPSNKRPISPSHLDLMDESNQPMISESRGNTVDGINLDEIKEFAKAFKLRRLSLGLTQTQVGQALSITEGPAYSQSAICSALATQMYCAAQLASQQQSMYKSGQNHLTEFIGVEPSKKRKRRTSFTPQALELLNAHFERNTHPSGTEITTLAHQLGYEREVIRIWFCNKRQALKNTVRMMSKGCT